MLNDKFSKIGFVLAMAGSAVGLGNAWKFPTMVGNNGGSAFIVLYLALTFGVAFVAFLAELSIGKLGETDIVNSMYKLAPKHKKAWSLTGFFMITAVLIASFYMVVIGWILYYIYISFTALPKDVSEAGAIFGLLLSGDVFSALICFSVVFFIVFFVVSKGIKGGIEKLNIWMMPTLFVLLVLMLFYSFSMADGFLKAAEFLFVPNFGAITADTVLMALGLAFFSLSMGVCTVPTYAANLSDGTNLVKATLSIIFINILIGIMMGLVVFTFVFAYGGDTTQAGPGLIFVSLTTLFAKLGIVGNILSVAFFTSLLFAGVTSAVSMIEPFVFYLVNKFKITRLNALIYIGMVVYVLGAFCIFSYYKPTSESFTFLGKPMFDFLDYATSNVLMPFGAIVFSFFVGFMLKKEALLTLFGSFMNEKVFEIWYFLLRYITPLAIIAIMLYQIFGS
ncbi:sodium-dependent transporter [Campylobacter sp. RM9344]|uniref:Sodium-dependent transporter n=1 Tax=Campylobacter californiensis TaxID=1032243 RepID=A0AAW3ZUB2_9BACT|nr:MULTISPECIES: sodium-dependent transporter [unclassified Campylobacter]MBE2984691.1 sodium-dependent transporter [Campylobacter sp. RM6883]MBE2994607.1 sodium-dependent transporter [Campylobacter sp. RM6913]MBE3029133.1 sodium-dependent transporter [Campylobacter sp. RM9344]MBE3608124.1 sodium-dependent transporter [Campylobacter sp. RM9337]QCD50415.1 Na+-dependent transporter, SNF family [Campylobacter sp. RM6914]